MKKRNKKRKIWNMKGEKKEVKMEEKVKKRKRERDKWNKQITTNVHGYIK